MEKTFIILAFTLICMSCTRTIVVDENQLYSSKDKEEYLSRHQVDTSQITLAEISSIENYISFQKQYEMVLPTVWLFNEKGKLLSNEEGRNNCLGLLSNLEAFKKPSNQVHLESIVDLTNKTDLAVNTQKNLIILWSIFLPKGNDDIFEWLKNKEYDSNLNIILLNVDIPLS